MYIKQISLVNFRNYKEIKISLNSGINIFVGNNGSGKTNIMESVYFLSMLTSFRTSEDTILINYNSEFLKINLKIFEEDIIKEYDAEYNKNTKRKTIKINGTRLKKLSDIIGKIPIVLFSPETINIVKGDPSFRRKFLDEILMQIYPDYYNLISKYNKEVSHRNYLLKKIREGEVSIENLKIWNEQIKEKGTKIILKRYELINNLNSIINSYLKNKNFNISITYQPKYFSVLEEKNLLDTYDRIFKEKQNEELARGITIIGPHRDDINILYNKNSSRFFSSEGEQRITTIILKLSEGLLLKKIKGTSPIILLDDFSSELDNINKNLINSFLEDFEQILITTVDMKNLSNLKINKMFFIEDGKIKES